MSKTVLKIFIAKLQKLVYYLLLLFNRGTGNNSKIVIVSRII